jgi:hypothetical protein
MWGEVLLGLFLRMPVEVGGRLVGRPPAWIEGAAQAPRAEMLPAAIRAVARRPSRAAVRTATGEVSELIADCPVVLSRFRCVLWSAPLDVELVAGELPPIPLGTLWLRPRRSAPAAGRVRARRFDRGRRDHPGRRTTRRREPRRTATGEARVRAGGRGAE